jgi:hypothetical protein
MLTTMPFPILNVNIYHPYGCHLNGRAIVPLVACYCQYHALQIYGGNHLEVCGFFCHSLPFHVSIFIECFLGLFYLKLIIGSLTRDCLGFMLCVSHISNKNPKDWLDSFSMLFLYPLL